MTIKARTAHTSRAVPGGYEVGMTARCAGCSAEVRGMIAWGEHHGEALTAANAILDAEARDRGWACRPNGDHCERHR